MGTIIVDTYYKCKFCGGRVHCPDADCPADTHSHPKCLEAARLATLGRLTYKDGGYCDTETVAPADFVAVADKVYSYTPGDAKATMEASIAREEKKRRRRRLISIILILIGAAMLAFELAGCATPTFCERDGWGPFPGDPVYKQGRRCAVRHHGDPRAVEGVLFVEDCAECAQ